MTARLVIGSKNADKIAEVESVLNELAIDLTLVGDLTWPDVEETGATLEENALLKAESVATHTGVAALADDTGLEVEVLGGAPGVSTARFAGEEASYADNVRKLLADLKGQEDRRARFRTVVAVVTPDGGRATAEGVLEGVITMTERGTGGFGYDPVFEVRGHTLAEMPAEAKNAISHRGRALHAIVPSLIRLLMAPGRDS